ncbi:hypothetical protein ABZP36_034808 [Zizania latifolia]
MLTATALPSSCRRWWLWESGDIRRRCHGDGERTVVVEDEQDEELDDEFLRYCAREKTTLPVSANYIGCIKRCLLSLLPPPPSY